MAKKETASPAIPVFPMLKTVEQMSKIIKCQDRMYKKYYIKMYS